MRELDLLSRSVKRSVVIVSVCHPVETSVVFVEIEVRYTLHAGWCVLAVLNRIVSRSSRIKRG